MAISLSHMQDLLGLSERILMQMVLVFYPSVTLPYIIRTILLFNWVIGKVNHQRKCLQIWIVVVICKIEKAHMLYWQSKIRPPLDRIIEKMSNLREALKMYLQWKMGPIWDLIAKMMNNRSDALKNYLTNDAARGHPMVKGIGNVVLFLAKCLFRGTELQLKYDESEVIITNFFFICSLLLRSSDHCSEELKIFCRRWGCKANPLADYICFLLALRPEIHYDNSLEILGVAFCLTIFNLCLLVVARPLTDFGFFGSTMGFVGSITYNRYGFKFTACTCLLIFCLKRWLEKHRSDFEQALPVRPISSTRGTCIFVPALHLSWTLIWLTDRNYHLKEDLLSGILWCYAMVCFFYFNFRPCIITETPIADHLLPYARFPLRTQSAHYRFLIHSLALNFSIILVTFDWWPEIKLLDLSFTFIHCCNAYMFLYYTVILEISRASPAS